MNYTYESNEYRTYGAVFVETLSEDSHLNKQEKYLFFIFIN
jgi:hypothetical protein